MNESLTLTVILSFLLFLAIVWAITKVIRFLASASRRKHLELSKLAHEAEGIKEALNPQR